MNDTLLQKIIGIILTIIGIAGSCIPLIFTGVFLLFTKLNYIRGYGDPRRRERDGWR